MSESYHREPPSPFDDICDLTETIALAGARDSFASVRHRYLTQYIPALNQERLDEYAYRNRLVPDEAPPSTPSSDLILSRWNHWLDCKELKTNPQFIGPERTAYYVKRALLLASLADHPYDKAGALLKVFKEYKEEVERKTGRLMVSRHIQLRNDMSDFMMTYASAELYQSSQAVTDKGIGAIINQSLDAIKPGDDTNAQLWRQKNEQIFSLYSRGVANIDVEVSAFNKRSEERGKAIKAIPKTAVYSLDWYYGGTHRQAFDAYTRKPNPGFVIEHYLLTHTADSWDRSFFVDAILRKFPDVIKVHAWLAGRTEESLEDHLQYNAAEIKNRCLAPAMPQAEFDAAWEKAEKLAWADYRRIRERAYHQSEGVLYNFLEPSDAELTPGLRGKPTNVFEHPYNDFDVNKQKRLLEKCIPGLGERYKQLREVQGALDLPEQEIRESFANTVAAAQKSTIPTKALDDLDIDFSSVTEGP